MTRVLAPLLLALLAGCSGASTAPLGAPLEADIVPVVRGVLDKESDPAVVAIDVGGEGLCAGTLLAPDVVLTVRHCVARSAPPLACPGSTILADRPASSLRILPGDDVRGASAVAFGSALVVPDGKGLCGTDIALILLDAPVAGVAPLLLREVGVALGDHVRTVDWSEQGARRLREHVPVTAAGYAEFDVGESSCRASAGGPALDEETGEVVGVLARWSSCDADVYTRTDVFYSLIDDALSRTAFPGKAKVDGGRRSQKPPSDLGGACRTGADCGAGVCVTEGQKQYCSRRCATLDPCPARFRCAKTGAGATVCAEK